tara:strand:+ start:832 stop:2403 length:1572 start_codon:yes stop_codon:yes gene_type:complete
MLSREISNEEYHTHPAIGSSAVKEVHMKSLLHWHKGQRKETPALNVGTAVHAMVLEPDKKLIICGPESRRGKAWTEAKEKADKSGMTLLTQPDYEMCQTIATSVMDNPDAALLINDRRAIKEASIFNIDPETGLELKVRPDLFIANKGVVLDLKTTRDASPSDRGFAKQVFQLGYHIQGAFYNYVLGLEGIHANEFTFLAVEKEPPYAVQIHTLAPEVLEFGLCQMRKTLRQIKEAKEEKHYSTGWPSVNIITLPEWLKSENRGIDDMADAYLIKDVEALFPKINQTYRFDSNANDGKGKSVPCAPLEAGSNYELQFKITKEKAQALYKDMVLAFRAEGEGEGKGWPDKFPNPFKKDMVDGEHTGLYIGKAGIAGAYKGESTRRPSQVDAKGTKLADDFLLTTGSTVNVAVNLSPWEMQGKYGVKLRLKGVQVTKYLPMEEDNLFGEVDGFTVEKDDNPFAEEEAKKYTLLNRDDLMKTDEVDEFNVEEEEVKEPKKVVKKTVKKAAPKKDDDLSDIIDEWDD